MPSVALIGYRNHAKRVHDAIRSAADVERLIFYHPEHRQSEVRELYGPGSEFTSDLREASTADLLFIASPNHTHVPYLEELLALSPRAAIYCEKPVAVSRADLDRLERFPLDDKRRIYFNFNYRFTELARLLREPQDDWGSLVHIDVIHCHGLAFQERYSESWRAADATHRLGVLETVGIHYLDLIDATISELTRCRSVLTCRSGRGTSADTALSTFQLRNGGLGSLLCSYAAPYARCLKLTFTNAIVDIGDMEMTVRSPRDTFDSHGRFGSPPVAHRQSLDLPADVRASLARSVGFFMERARSAEGFDPEDFDRKVRVNRMLLESTQEPV